MNYDWTKTKQTSEAYGLFFRDNVAQAADTACKNAGLSQAQVDTLGVAWCDFAMKAFNRKSYSFIKRLKMAAYWLGITPNHIK